MEFPKRDLVLVVGGSHLSLAPFTERDLKVERVTTGDAPGRFNEACAVVVADFPDRFGLIKASYADLFPNAQGHDLAQVVIVHTQENLIQACAIKQKDFRDSTSRSFLIAELSKAAEFVARYPVGPPAGNVKIEPNDAVRSDDERLLLQRAFSDSERIFLEPIAGGKASVAVFRVHAWLSQSQVGPRPLPFFVKLATPQMVDEERTNYRLYAEHYIPFNLRPNLDPARCVRTRTLAALVGNFVDDAVPLRRSLRSGHGVGALFALFETTLKGFRSQPFIAHQEPIPNALEPFAKGRIRTEALDKVIVERAHALGLESNAEDLQEMICNAAKGISCFVGPCHGDLHSGNIMVRGGDAIVIDFSSATNAPLTADPAALEVSLMFGTDDRDRPDCFPDWCAFIDNIYTPNNPNLHPYALFDVKPGRFSWLRRSLRELRHVLLGCNAGPEEASIVLAAYLLRYARLGVEDFGDEKLKKLAFDRHAYALVVAERIVRTLGKKVHDA